MSDGTALVERWLQHIDIILKIWYIIDFYIFKRMYYKLVIRIVIINSKQLFRFNKLINNLLKIFVKLLCNNLKVL